MLPLPQHPCKVLNNQCIYQLLLTHDSGMLQINGRERSVLTAQGSTHGPRYLLFIQHTLLIEICYTKETYLSGWQEALSLKQNKTKQSLLWGLRITRRSECVHLSPFPPERSLKC